MSQAIHQPIDETAAPEAGCSNGQSFSPKPRSFDYRGQRPLDWSEIETALHKLSAQAMAVEMIGRGAQDDIHGDRLTGVFDFVSEEIVGQIKQLQALLGLKDEGAQQ